MALVPQGEEEAAVVHHADELGVLEPQLPGRVHRVVRPLAVVERAVLLQPVHGKGVLRHADDHAVAQAVGGLESLLRHHKARVRRREVGGEGVEADDVSIQVDASILDDGL